METSPESNGISTLPAGSGSASKRFWHAQCGNQACLGAYREIRNMTVDEARSELCSHESVVEFVIQKGLLILKNKRSVTCHRKDQISYRISAMEQ